ncbi:UbiA family prenyltransferase [bacterium]|nr:UbiA family prenyltransferase [bacterium]
MEFLKNYIKSMRLYYAFVTLTCGWAGVAAFQYKSTYGNNILESYSTEFYNTIPFLIDKIIVLTIMFVGWGVNQIVNDYMGLKEDRINAPERPMVTGKLKPIPALSVSLFVILIAVVWSIYKNPVSLIPLLGGVIMNMIYSVAKGYGILGNITFGLSISSCMVYSYTVLGGNLKDFFTDNYTLFPWIYVVIFNMIMTYYTYFKDYNGDKASNKNTLVVKLGLKRASFLGLFLSAIPIIMFASSKLLGDFVNAYPSIQVKYYIISYLIAGLLFIYTGFLYYKTNTGDKTYFNLKYNFAALSACQAAIVSFYCSIGNFNYEKSAIYNLEGLILTIISVISVLTIFKLGYKNAKS